MISRNRSAPTIAAISIDPTTSANSTVTCLYSAVVSDSAIGDPHSSQNFAVGRNSAPHFMQANAAVMRLTIGRSPAQDSAIGALRWVRRVRYPPDRRLLGHADRSVSAAAE